MFGMKNEGDETATKKKTSISSKSMDKDRREKGWYAILVTLLEADSRLYHNSNCRCVLCLRDVLSDHSSSCPMITLLRNAALNSLNYKQELALVRAEHYYAFWEDLDAFKVALPRTIGLLRPTLARPSKRLTSYPPDGRN